MAHVPTLPPNFPAQLLDLELELETHCCPTTITALINLYQEAIVYFEHFKTEDYHTYQARLQKLLFREDVQAAMRNPYRESASPTTIREKREFFQRQESTFSLTPTEAKRDTVRAHDLGSASASQRVIKDVISQQSALDVRLTMRKMKGKTWTTLTPRVKRTAFVFDDVSEVVSAMETLMPVPEENSLRQITTFGKKLEEVMEKHFAEKASKISEVRLKYQLQIQELEETSNPFIDQVIGQMKIAMETEIEKVTVEFDLKRKAAIEEVKAEYIVS